PRSSDRASDGDNWNDDSPLCRDILVNQIMPQMQYFTYVEITPREHQALWYEYNQVAEAFPESFAQQQLVIAADIYPVFRELFQRRMDRFGRGLTDRGVRSMKRQPISTGSEWTFDLIRAYDREIGRIAEGYALDTYPNQIEVITAEQMMDAYASVGMPLGYHHWSYGKHFLSTEKSYTRGQ